MSFLQKLAMILLVLPGALTLTSIDVLSQAQSEEAIHELASRLLTPRSAYRPNPGNLQLLVGQLPEALANLDPLPAGSRVVGSMTSEWGRDIAIVELPMALDAALDLFRAAMESKGWKPLGAAKNAASYFVSAHQITFCSAPYGPALLIGAYRMLPLKTEVRLELHRTYGCASSSDERLLPGELLLPILISPPDVRQISGGSGASNSDSAHTELMLETDLTVRQLLSHYSGQLARTQWKLTGTDTADKIGHTSWTVKDSQGQTWYGLLQVTEVPPIPGRRFVVLMVNRMLSVPDRISSGKHGSWNVAQ